MQLWQRKVTQICVCQALPVAGVVLLLVFGLPAEMARFYSLLQMEATAAAVAAGRLAWTWEAQMQRVVVGLVASRTASSELQFDQSLSLPASAQLCLWNSEQSMHRVLWQQCTVLMMHTTNCDHASSPIEA